LFVLEGGFAYLMTHTGPADDVAAGVPPEQTLGNPFNDLRAHLEDEGKVR
jgi:hypothetical protein